MPAIAEINEEQIRFYINRAVGDVFKTMLGRNPSSTSHAEHVVGVDLKPVESPQPQIVGTVGFIGDVNGLIYLYFDLAFARTCTCHMLGMTEAELEEAGDDAINDAVGEITNMTVGSFKNGLSDCGFPCRLTIPSIVRGSNFVIEPISSAIRHVFHFHCENHRVVADILLQKDD